MKYERTARAIRNEPLPPSRYETYEAWLEAERARLMDQNSALAALNRDQNWRLDALSDIITESVARGQKGFTLWLLGKYLSSLFR